LASHVGDTQTPGFKDIQDGVEAEARIRPNFIGVSAQAQVRYLVPHPFSRAFRGAPESR
jgi:hypothetical protein